MSLFGALPAVDNPLGKVAFGLTGALLPALLHLGSPASATSITTISAGHVDAIDIAWEDGELALSVHDETVEPGVERDPGTVKFVALPNSAVEIPDDPAYGFLGAPGGTAWILPEVQDENLLWAGISTGELESGIFTDDRVKVRFTKFVGPNGVSLFDTAADGGPHILADSEDDKPDVITLAAGVHQHQNWAFEAPGTYKISYKVTGRLAATGERVASRTETITFAVKAS